MTLKPYYPFRDTNFDQSSDKNRNKTGKPHKNTKSRYSPFIFFCIILINLGEAQWKDTECATESEMTCPPG